MVRIFFPLLVLFAILSSGANAQIYDSDSLRVEIKYKTNLRVNNFEDLNIEVVFFAKSRRKKTFIYQSLENATRSNLGNCYFELYKYDSTLGGYKNITFNVLERKHPPQEFKNHEELLKYDLKKSELKFDEKKVLTFNLLNFISILEKGSYSMLIGLRISNTFGYDRNGKIIANSQNYLESATINFEVLRTVTKPPATSK